MAEKGMKERKMHLRRKIHNLQKRINKRISSPFGGILMFHRIAEHKSTELPMNESLKVSPQRLDDLISLYKSKGYTFVSMDEIADIVEHRRKADKVLAITLDDGYLDNYTNGLPIFKAHNVPFCIYVATKMPQKEMFFWWYMIEDIVLQNDTVTLSNGTTFHCETKEKKEQLSLAMRTEVLGLPQKQLEDKMTTLCRKYNIDIKAYNDTLPITWDAIKALRDEPLCTIGNHTHSHQAFSQCCKNDITSDIERAQKMMHKKTGIETRHFAFPYGTLPEVEYKHIYQLRQLGFQSAVTTYPESLNRFMHTYALPRIAVTENNLEWTLEVLRDGWVLNE